MVRYWLKATATGPIEIKWGIGKHVTSQVLEISIDPNSSRRFISVDINPNSPADMIPRIDQRHVNCVTYVARYYDGFRYDGIYRQRGAKAQVLTVVNFLPSSSGGNIADAYQEISISADSIQKLKKIYSAVRRGELNPAETWSADIDAEPGEAEVSSLNEPSPTVH